MKYLCCDNDVKNEFSSTLCVLSPIPKDWLFDRYCAMYVKDLSGIIK